MKLDNLAVVFIGTDKYLKFLPYNWTLIEKRLQNPVLKNLKLLFYNHLSIKKLKKLSKI